MLPATVQESVVQVGSGCDTLNWLKLKSDCFDETMELCDNKVNTVQKCP